MTTTQQLLDILRDVEPGPERDAIVEELGCDAAHVGPTYEVTVSRYSSIHSNGFRKLLAGEWIMPADASRRRIDRLQRRDYAPNASGFASSGTYAPSTSVLLMQRIPGDSYRLTNITEQTACGAVLSARRLV